MTIDEIIDSLNAFQPAAPTEDFNNCAGDRQVRALFEMAVASPEANRAIPAMLAVVERHPEAHFYFAYLANLLERCPGYEAAVLDALKRAPTPLVLIVANHLRAREAMAAGVIEQIAVIAQDSAVDRSTRFYAEAIVKARPIEQILADFAGFAPTDSKDFNYAGRTQLEALCNEALMTPTPARAISAIIQIIEHFPDSDLGTPGPLVHALEQVSGYEPALIESVKRSPSPLSVEMIGRLRNAAPTDHERANWNALLAEVAARETIHPDAKAVAEMFVNSGK